MNLTKDHPHIQLCSDEVCWETGELILGLVEFDLGEFRRFEEHIISRDGLNKEKEILTIYSDEIPDLRKVWSFM